MKKLFSLLMMLSALVSLPLSALAADALPAAVNFEVNKSELPAASG
jgi:hypothetical protein